jgi:ABC-type uncharacterized transport system involved in gliding motility auxiliary subunit
VNWRERFKDQKIIYGTGSLVSVLLVVGSIIVAAWLADWHQVRWDLTRGQTQSLSAVTRNLVKQVDQPLIMTAFLPEGSGERDTVKDVLQRYAYLNPKIRFQFVDPEREPLKAKEAGYRFSGNVLLTYRGKQQMADRADEDALSNTLRRILKTESKKLYFLTGHGERSLTSGEKDGLQVANRALENEGYEVANLNLVAQSQVPQDAEVVIVASPAKPLLTQEIGTLKAYLDRGGRVLIMLEAFQDGGLKGFLAGYGLLLDDGIILDYNQLSESLRLSPILPMAFQYGPTRITLDFKNIFTIFPLSRPLTLNQEAKGVSLLPIVSTMATSYEKLGKGWLQTDKADYDSRTDKRGPFNLGALAEIKLAPTAAGKEPAPAVKKPEAEKKAYLAVYGDMDFATNAYFNLFGNGDLFLNTVNFLASEETQIMVREALKAQFLMLSSQEYWLLFLVSLVFGPLVMLLTGVWAYRTRRARK